MSTNKDYRNHYSIKYLCLQNKYFVTYKYYIDVKINQAKIRKIYHCK